MPFTTVSTVVVTGVIAVVVVLVVAVTGAMAVVVRVVVGGVDMVLVGVDVVALLQDAATRARAIKPVLNSIRQWILYGNWFFS